MENQVFYSSFNNCSLIRGKEKTMKREGGEEKDCQISSRRILNLSALRLTIQMLIEPFGKQNG